MDKEKTNDSKYIQQHLANERTFLAWVRTSITIVGLGFLAAGLTFRAERYRSLENLFATAVGIGSVLLGSVMMLLATSSYFSKRRGINEETFRSPGYIVLISFACLAFVDVLLIALVVISFFA